MTDEQFEWFQIVGGMMFDGLKFEEAMGFCRRTMDMPTDIFLWMIQRQRSASTKAKEAVKAAS
jgi:hypothetical protein